MPVQCPKCQSAFDVSHLEPGTVFVCGNCQAQLRAPGAPPGPATTKKSMPSRPAARPGRAKAANPRRAGAAAPAAAGGGSRGGTATRGRPSAGERRGRRSPRDRGGRSDEGGPNLPLILGGVGGVLLLLVVVMIFAFGGGDEPADNGGGTDVTSNETSRDEIVQRVKDLNLNLMKAETASELRSIHERATELGVDGRSIATQAAERTVQIAPDQAWAQEALGREKFDRSDLPDDVDVMYPDENYEKVLEYMDKGWLEPAEVKEAEAAKDAFLEHHARIRSDAHYKKIWHWRGLVKKDPIFGGYKYRMVEARPYLLFIEDTGDANRLAALEKKAKRSAKIFTRLYEVFLDTFQEPFGLKRLESDKYEEDVILKAWLFASYESFQKYQNEIRQPVPAGVAAYYSPSTQWMIIPDSGSDPTGDGFNTGKYFHEGTHQLIHHYTKWLIEEETGEELIWTDDRLDSDAHWWQEGIAELFGNVKNTGDSWELFQYSKNRMQTWRQIRAQKAQEWDFLRMLQATGNRDVMVSPRYMAPLFYSQSWAFVYFLWNYEDGKYRDKLFEYTKAEFHGKSGLETFKKVFGLDEIKGSQLEKEYFEYAEELLKNAPGHPAGVGGGD